MYNALKVNWMYWAHQSVSVGFETKNEIHKTAFFLFL